MDDIRGFTRETFIEITTNIESQELRRIRNNEIGYPEHPRAATTDDVECFFSLTRRHLGETFTLKEFKNEGFSQGKTSDECAVLLSEWAKNTFKMTASHPAGGDESGNPNKNLWAPPEGTCPAPPAEKKSLV